MDIDDDNVRLRIYLDENKRHGDRPLYEAIVLKAREQRLAGATVVRATGGYGRSLRLRTADIVFSEDLPVIVEIIDKRQKIQAFAERLKGFNEIGLATIEDLTVIQYTS